MPKISKTFFAALLVVLNYGNATYSNLLFHAPSVAFPGTYFSSCGPSSTVCATDGVITRYETGSNCDDYYGFNFLT